MPSSLSKIAEKLFGELFSWTYEDAWLVSEPGVVSLSAEISSL